ncbi:hypothetical protein A9G28_12885 [Gilliamella sp. Fer1-1]|jgi:hypothetical protein|uniref:tail fiber assembly protein n=1 Tax=Gilliamella sp. Fer1-1 TaxID=3120240 RepID=UPI00080DAC87|nr:tail fiber assembly protein [Gilliamella apicola]OCG45166.1 hypothetical protein A9G28_12885 [Gilliamella apicola]
MKYQIKPEVAEFGQDGFTTKAGYALVYNTDLETGEFLGAMYEYLPVGLCPPPHVCLDAPQPVDNEHAIVRVGDEWVYPADHRGKKIYLKSTGEESTVTGIGDIPDDYTLLKPSGEFDVWNGKKWEIDKEKQHQHYVNLAIAQKNQLLNEAKTQIEFLQDAIDAEIATDDEQKLYAEWKKYRVLLNRIDVNDAENVEWPEKPNNL